MTTFPTLHTPRLTLGQLEISDIPNIVEYAGSPNIAKMLRDLPHPYAEKTLFFGSILPIRVLPIRRNIYSNSD